MKIFSRFAVIFLLILAAACAKKTTLGTVTNKPSGADNNSSAAIILQQGKALYDNKCGVCHMLHQPSEFNHTDWDGILKGMFVKAQIVDTAQQKLIRTYVYSGS